jgi:RNA 2',3'-cyclic 3'-phosphodiesterase
MVQQQHFFFAIRIPEETKLALKEYCHPLKLNFPFSRWVHELDYHITLAFLGHAPKNQLDMAKGLVSQQLNGCYSFSLTIDSFGIFGKKESPRIFWAGVQQEEKLHGIRNAVFSACEQAGFKLETRPFHPHITIARKWMGEAPFPIQLFEDEKRLSKPLLFQADEVVLYQTFLDETPKYKAIEVYPLKSNGTI